MELRKAYDKGTILIAILASVAKVAEDWASNPRVLGSIPITSGKITMGFP